VKTQERVLRIDKEFAGLCFDLTAEEQDLLEAQITSEGCRDSIVVWANHNDTILDGHNRYRICRRFDVPFKTKALKIENREEAVNWIINTQLGRRNSTDEQKSYLRGKRYLGEKQVASDNLMRGDKPPKGHNDPSGNTAEKLAKDYDVAPKTIRRDAAFARAVDKIEQVAGPEAKKAILSGTLGATKKDVIAIAELPKAEQKKALRGGKEAIKEAIKPDWAKGPTPEEQANADPERRWCASLHKLYVFMNSTRDAGGIRALVKKWTDKGRQEYVVELKRIIGELEKWIVILEKSK